MNFSNILKSRLTRQKYSNLPKINFSVAKNFEFAKINKQKNDKSAYILWNEKAEI